MDLEEIPPGGIFVRTHLHQLPIAAPGEVLFVKGVAYLRSGVVVQLVEEQLISLKGLVLVEPLDLIWAGPGLQKGRGRRVCVL